ncbi:glycoside hydrolase family 5 protein [Bacteroides sp. OttesenSCG-928-J23]|nr:glycoside hydrolase family 5 protein [Bacteroides sp. OttesenSCG-928-J23]
MQRLIFTLITCLICVVAQAQPKSSEVYVDKHGVMRHSGSRQEASFFGVNYTLPFAHAYRAMGYLGVDRKAAIDRDVYHFARLGFNAYRIHIWDVEITDAQGNLLENDHLDLLDYLIYKLKERGIRTVLTAMTTFGNGYPERNQPTDGFSYLYDKCQVHAHPDARRAQQNYIAQLVTHINPYTGKAYLSDPDIVGFEINNEPCHSGTQQDVKEYIDGMLTALKAAGNRKPVFYNVAQSYYYAEAYYSTAVQGTTYQWYPVGLVAGRTRIGNFLPNVDKYNIPFDVHKGYANKARLIYEYDPADNIYSYLHPAMARTLRTAGFQWITQFAYDPIDMARYNTEYQTHFLNLAYTPRKAISMKIAAEAAYRIPRGKSYGTYPADTLFADFRVSYLQDLSELNSSTQFFYSNNTSTHPVDAHKLQAVAGCGTSPVVKYEGTGAYFLDKLEEGVWRLELMPDAVLVADPFAKPSLKKEVANIIWNRWDMQIALPDLGNEFSVEPLNAGNTFASRVNTGIISQIGPGVYLLTKKGIANGKKWTPDTRMGAIALGEFVAPQPHTDTYTVMHTAAPVVEEGKPYTIEAQVTGPQMPDSVIVYTSRISFWNDHNPHYVLHRTHGYTYRGTIPAEEIQGRVFRYNMLVCKDGKFRTFPAGVEGSPLDWDYTDTNCWTCEVAHPQSPVRLVAPTDQWPNNLELMKHDEATRRYLRKNIAPEIAARKAHLPHCNTLTIDLEDTPGTITVALIDRMGYTYAATFAAAGGVNKIPLAALRTAPTALLPQSYPMFSEQFFVPNTQTELRLEDVEVIELSFEPESRESGMPKLKSITLTP